LPSYKCQFCGFKDDVSELVKGVHSKGYIHKKCIHEYEVEKAFKEKERSEMDSLTDTIVHIMGYKNRQSIPHTFYSSYLQPFRNDDVLFGKIEKNFKQGFTYKTIEETFNYKKADIQKYINMKRQKNEFENTLHELRYAWKIVRENIENMLRDKKKAVSKETSVIATSKHIEAMTDVALRIKEVQHRPMQEDDEVDITKLFD
jgi:hypothetical protein